MCSTRFQVDFKVQIGGGDHQTYAFLKRENHPTSGEFFPMQKNNTSINKLVNADRIAAVCPALNWTKSMRSNNGDIIDLFATLWDAAVGILWETIGISTSRWAGV